MDVLPCPKCGHAVDMQSRRCPIDGYEIDDTDLLAVAATITPEQLATQKTAGANGDLVGRKLGKYVLKELIGRGATASVWSAEHQEIGGNVAVKVLDQRPVDGAEAHERFLREARVSAKLDHDHVVKVIDFGRDASVGSYIVMERLTGQPLDRLIAAEAPLDERRVVALALQVTDALGAAHALGIVHRDLKPGNIFLTRSLGTEVVKVVDFGIARVTFERATDLTGAGVVYGTPLYMSPEQWDNVGVGPASDIYALGVVLYEALTGRLPIAATAITEMAKKVALEEPPSMRATRPNLSPGVDAIVLRCLQKEPEDRFATMMDLADSLRELQDRKTAPKRSRLKGLVLPAVGAVLLAQGGFTAARWRSNEHVPQPEIRAAAEAPRATEAAASLPLPAPVAPVVVASASASTAPVARVPGATPASTAARQDSKKPKGRPASASRGSGVPSLYADDW
ncbi:serine/threonine protein kinase [Labilithrix luteola]|uniref:Serine/threonine protein kinase n=1 Tax=Labilithrix luteola TaxID=1391654 RepID=A0A0K1Q067_9BACT|nr:serine/threonine-protein kinase [Labilithrix luteola]AKU98784.1 serine/threonine protein kinase [Labilithrix luteola]